jgi:hypothetical protein
MMYSLHYTRMESAKHDFEIGDWCTAHAQKIIETLIIFRKNNEFILLCFAYSSIIIWIVTISYVSKSESVKLRF